MNKNILNAPRFSRIVEAFRSNILLNYSDDDMLLELENENSKPAETHNSLKFKFKMSSFTFFPFVGSILWRKFDALIFMNKVTYLADQVRELLDEDVKNGVFKLYDDVIEKSNRLYSTYYKNLGEDTPMNSFLANEIALDLIKNDYIEDREDPDVYFPEIMYININQIYRLFQKQKNFIFSQTCFTKNVFNEEKKMPFHRLEENDIPKHVITLH